MYSLLRVSLYNSNIIFFYIMFSYERHVDASKSVQQQQQQHDKKQKQKKELSSSKNQNQRKPSKQKSENKSEVIQFFFYQNPTLQNRYPWNMNTKLK